VAAETRSQPAERLGTFLALTTLGLPALLLLARTTGSPLADALARDISLTGMRPDLERALGDIVFLPLRRSSW
jgi:hypothetical protein